MNANDARYSVDEIARAWVVKMRGVSSDALRAEFKEWLASAPEHRAAYYRVERQLDRAAILKISSRFGEDRAGRRSQLLAGRWLSWGAFATIAGLLLIGYGAFGATLPGPFSAGSAKAVAAETFTTDRGEIRRFQLADGSVAILDTASRLDVMLHGGSRRVRVIRGRVRFAISADGRPFTAEANGVAVRAENAEFDLAVAGPGTGHVALWRGTARISGLKEAGGSMRDSIRLQPANAFVFKSEENRLLVESAPDQDVREWPDGWADYRSVTLARLVGDANRYARRPIILDTPALARIEVSGRFKISETEVFTRQIAALLDLAVTQEVGGLHLRKK